MDKVYVMQIAFSGENGNGVNYQCQSAKNKKEAIEKALKNLQNFKCVFLSIKRVSRKLADIIENHNKK